MYNLLDIEPSPNPKQSHLPNLSRKQPIHSVIQLIKLKKAEFSKQVEQYNQPTSTPLPSINPNNSNHKPHPPPSLLPPPLYAYQTQEQSNYDLPQKQSIQTANNHFNNFNKKKSIHLSLSNKNKTTVDKALFEKNSNQKQKDQPLKKQRVQTQNTQFQLKNPTKVSKASKPNSNSVQRVSKQLFVPQDYKQEKIQQIIQKFGQAIAKVPKNMKQRNQQNLDQTVIYLQSFNPFFNRNQRIVNICLLKMGKIILKDSPFQLYKAGEQLDSFYIILHGRIKITQQGGGSKRICLTGQTILQQTIFSPTIKKVALENAKVLGVCYLLEMKIEEYKKMKEELTRYGLRQSFNETQAIIKRNFITKNWMRNKKKGEGCNNNNR